MASQSNHSRESLRGLKQEQSTDPSNLIQMHHGGEGADDLIRGELEKTAAWASTDDGGGDVDHPMRRS
jgi:hypothetical protein